ncbi:MAG TPA: hypothetical protein VG826_03255 [Pirellulales bacterium]|nr:hypothetical protein [Pirellulales bacterium]
MSRRFQFSLRQILAVTAFAALATVSFQGASEDEPSSFGWGVLAVAFLFASLGTLVRDIETGVRWGVFAFLGVAVLVTLIHLR